MQVGKDDVVLDLDISGHVNSAFRKFRVFFHLAALLPHISNGTGACAITLQMHGSLRRCAQFIYLFSYLFWKTCIADLFQDGSLTPVPNEQPHPKYRSAPMARFSWAAPVRAARRTLLCKSWQGCNKGSYTTEATDWLTGFGEEQEKRREILSLQATLCCSNLNECAAAREQE